jgi:hypothetical protein
MFFRAWREKLFERGIAGFDRRFIVSGSAPRTLL